MWVSLAAPLRLSGSASLIPSTSLQEGLIKYHIIGGLRDERSGA